MELLRRRKQKSKTIIIIRGLTVFITLEVVVVVLVDRGYVQYRYCSRRYRSWIKAADGTAGAGTYLRKSEKKVLHYTVVPVPVQHLALNLLKAPRTPLSPLLRHEPRVPV